MSKYDLYTQSIHILNSWRFNSTVAQCEEEDRYIEDKVDILVKGMGEKMCGEEVIKDMCCEMCKDKWGRRG